MGNGSTAELIQQRMSQIRHDLDETVDEISDQARQLRDWRYYMQRYPWLVAGVAAAVGYLVVPTRSKVYHLDPEKLAELGHREKVVVESRPGMAQFLVRTAFNHLSSALLRSAAGYLGSRLGVFPSEKDGPYGASPKPPSWSQS
jgi:hypothetical protein